MTYRYSIFLILATISGDTAPLGAHVGDRLYPISYLSEETLAALDLDNANVEDWVEAVGEPTLTLLDFDLRPSYTQVTSYGPSNLDFRIWLGWEFSARTPLTGRSNFMSPALTA